MIIQEKKKVRNGNPERVYLLGEFNMPGRCVINVSQIKAVDKNAIGDLIGALSTSRLHEVYAGILLVMGIDDDKMG